MSGISPESQHPDLPADPERDKIFRKVLGLQPDYRPPTDPRFISSLGTGLDRLGPNDRATPTLTARVASENLQAAVQPRPLESPPPSLRELDSRKITRQIFLNDMGCFASGAGVIAIVGGTIYIGYRGVKWLHQEVENIERRYFRPFLEGR